MMLRFAQGVRLRNPAKLSRRGLHRSLGNSVLKPEMGTDTVEETSKVVHKLFFPLKVRCITPANLKQIIEIHRNELTKLYSPEEISDMVVILPKKFSAKSSQLEQPEQDNAVTSKKGKKLSLKKETDKIANKELMYKSQSANLIQSLTAYVEVCVNVGNYELAKMAVELYIWKLKQLHKRYSSGPPDPFPVDIFNTLLRGCAICGKYEKASEVHHLMIWHNVPLNAVSYSYLLATAKGKDDVISLLRTMKLNNIKLDDLFKSTQWSEPMLQNLQKNIRACEDTRNFEIPPTVYPKKTTCELAHVNINSPLSKLADTVLDNNVKLLSYEELKVKANEQEYRETNSPMIVKSIDAPSNPNRKIQNFRELIANIENAWRKDLRSAFYRQLDVTRSQLFQINEMSIYPFLLVLKPSMYIELMIQEMRFHAMSSASFSLGTNALAAELGRKVELFYNLHTISKSGLCEKMKEIYEEYLSHYDHRGRRPPREIWQELAARNPAYSLCVEQQKFAPWPKETAVIVGRFLYKMMRELKVNVNCLNHFSNERAMMNALYSVYRSHNEKIKEELKVHDVLTKLYQRAKVEDLYFDTTLLPMLSPPKPWTSPESTPFLFAKTQFLRVVIGDGNAQTELVKNSPVEQLYPCIDALNVLSRTPWIVNRAVLDVMITVFRTGGNMDLAIPPNPFEVKQQLMASANETVHKTKLEVIMQKATARQQHDANYSLWCDMLYKLSIANHFKNDIFWFPHNMDFRGRVYPCPPHFNHLGGDPVRSLLLFAEGQPLGKNGLNWLKLHLVNLTGLKKKESLKTRIEYAEKIMDEILDSADKPLSGNRWWQSSDDPWQTLAVCMEVAKAIRSEDPTKYICHLPIHQDGSCNGLQHYAALGRDLDGARQVNLCPTDLPQDVYSGVAEIVERQRKLDAENGLQIAGILENHIQRKVVKQTVMTVVYGVTRYGAQLQILGQLKDLKSFPKEHLSAGSHYLTAKTFASLEMMFTATREIQDWFGLCSRMISGKMNQPVIWTTPLGLPVVQPYYKRLNRKAVLGAMDSDGRRSYIRSVQPDSRKQKNGFAPNFIHSLDSSHMMLTAIHSQAAGICFVSIHDCFWTHANSVEIMNKICREQFVALHSQPILENLSHEFQNLYCQNSTSDNEACLDDANEIFSKIPAKGKFNLEDILQSVYFFS